MKVCNPGIISKNAFDFVQNKYCYLKALAFKSEALI